MHSTKGAHSPDDIVWCMSFEHFALAMRRIHERGRQTALNEHSGRVEMPATLSDDRAPAASLDDLKARDRSCARPHSAAPAA